MPALEVGGDYFDIIKLKNGKNCILIGDVSGKGMNAAFYMAQLKGVVLSVAKESIGAVDVLKRINTVLFHSMEKQMFITLSALTIENGSGMVSFARAGHMPTIIVNNGNVEEIIPKGIGIGLADSNFFDNIIEEVSFQLNENDKCIMITDGVVDARNFNGEDFTLSNLKQIIQESVYSHKDGLIFNIKDNLEQFLKDGLQRDDLTVVTIEYKKNNK
jgi:serine phosphatase RsbU (regulator of sigma subunit)